MKSILWSLLLVASSTINAQSISLLADGNPGPDSSVRGQSVIFNGDIFYMGFKNGESSNQVFQYDVSEGTAEAVTGAINGNATQLAATESRLYYFGTRFLNYYDVETQETISAGSVPSGQEIIAIYPFGDVLAVVVEDFVLSNIYLIRDDESEISRINELNMPEEISVNFGNNIITTRPIDNSSDVVRANLFIDASTFELLDPATVLEGSTCGTALNIFAVGDYIMYDCSEGSSFIFNTIDKTHTEFPGQTNAVREGADYIFFDAGPQFFNNLYSLNKLTNEVLQIADGRIQDIGILDEAGERLYFLKSTGTDFYSINGSGEETRYTTPANIKAGGTMQGVLTFDDVTMVALDENVRDMWTFRIEEDIITPLTDITDFSSDHMPFLNLDGDLVFSYRDPVYGAELFLYEIGTTGVFDSEHTSFVTYPNPAQDVLQFKFDEDSAQLSGEISIIDNFGRVISTATLDRNSIDVSALTPGMYYLSFQSNEKNYMHKFIKG